MYGLITGSAVLSETLSRGRPVEAVRQKRQSQVGDKTMNMTKTGYGVLVYLSAAAFLSAAQSPVSLPPGETGLSDIGIYQISYQSYGKAAVQMPLSWVGRLHEPSGIMYLPGQQVLGRQAILMHSPWRVPAGKTWADYSLRLPPTTPVTLSFGIAMRPDIAVPDKSDGVTFSCYLLDGTTERELMRHHHDKGQWLDYRFDLSAYAGKDITLRLQTEPGPKNNSAFDFSYFGEAKITVGAVTDNRSAMLDRLTSAQAYRAAEGASLLALANRSGRGVTPSNLLPAKNSIVQTPAGYDFHYEGPDARIVYHFVPKTGTLDDFTVEVDRQSPFSPAAGGGVTVVQGKGGQAKALPAGGGKADRIELAGDGSRLNVAWNYNVEGVSFQVRWQFGISGKALTVAAACDQPVLDGLSLGGVGGAPLRRFFAMPYLPSGSSSGLIAYLPVENVFVFRMFDWTASHASACPEGQAHYEPKTDGTYNTLVESGYIAVSPHLGEVLPNIPHRPSPFLSQLGPLVMLDLWDHYQGTYQGDAELLRILKDNGVDHLAIISHVWQRYGYDVKLPDHLPANPQFGGDEGMMEFGKAANACGYIWSLHENYIDLYPDAPSYRASARVLGADGTPSPAWYNEGTQTQSFGLKCTEAMDYAKQNSPEIHKRFQTNAGYLDVHTCVPPWHQLDHEAGQPMASMALAKVKYDTQLFQFMRDTHQGPLFGEGANHVYWAGLCDGVEAQVAGGQGHSPCPDFDLLKLHPQMVNHGMGYYERWFESGYGLRWGQDAGTPEQVDQYRAQELAYGHAGFIGSSQTANVQWVAKEHHIMHAVQALYAPARVTGIGYEIDGRFVSASAALVAGDLRRQRISYDSGLTLWVNWDARPWTVEGRVLPQWGYLTLGPGTEACMVLRDGKFADYVNSPEYLFIDARTSFNMPYRRNAKDIRPRLAEMTYLGDGKIRVMYEWQVNDTLEADYSCFVHFINEQSKRGEKIEFQQDHALSAPAGRWQKGQTVLDGPYTVSVPADGFDTYDLTIGLFKDQRLALKGPSMGGLRIWLGRLQVQRQEGKISNITLMDKAPEIESVAAAEADFTSHLNPAGTWVDFGTAATDGSVKIQKGPSTLTVFPYPRDVPLGLRLNLRTLLPKASLDRLEVRALAAGTQQDMGTVDHQIKDGFLTLTLGLKGAGRYVISCGQEGSM
jgi:hypothetical protein